MDDSSVFTQLQSQITDLYQSGEPHGYRDMSETPSQIIPQEIIQFHEHENYLEGDNYEDQCLDTCSRQNYNSEQIEDMLATESKCVKYADTSKYQIEDYGSESNLDIQVDDTYYGPSYYGEETYNQGQYDTEDPIYLNLQGQYESKNTLQLIGTKRHCLISESNRNTERFDPYSESGRLNGTREGGNSGFKWKDGQDYQKFMPIRERVVSGDSRTQTPSRIELKSINENGLYDDVIGGGASEFDSKGVLCEVEESRIGDETMIELTLMKERVTKSRRRIEKRQLSPLVNKYSSFGKKLSGTENILNGINTSSQVQTKHVEYKSKESDDTLITDYSYSVMTKVGFSSNG